MENPALAWRALEHNQIGGLARKLNCYQLSQRRMQHNRDRPLQNSMFLSDGVGGMKRSSIDYGMPLGSPNTIPNHAMSKSMMFNDQSKHMNMMGPPRAQYHPYNQDNGYGGGSSNLEKAIQDINEKLEKMSKTVDKHETQLGSFSIESDISKKILNEIRQSIPLVTGNNDVYEHIFNIKLDLKAVSEEIERMPRFKDLEKVSLPRTMSGSDASSNEPPVTQDMIKKRDEFFQKIISNLESEVMILKKNIGSMKTEMKVSPIASSSCIMLKYQELFKSRNKSQSDMILSQHTYYIDNEGYLLDCHSRYIVDQKGKKVRLEDKHITMLKNQRILS